MIRRILAALTVWCMAVVPAHALFDSKVEKAQKLIQVERYADAMQLLDEAILDDPTDPETHFGVGQAYLSMGRDAQAEKTFSVLVRKLDASYGPKVATLFLNKGDWQRAVEFDPSRKVGLAQDFFTKGKAAVNAGDPSGAARSFQAATSLDPSLNAEVHEIYYRRGAEAPDEACLPWYREAKRYGGSHDGEITAHLMKIAAAKDFGAREKLRSDFDEFLDSHQMKEAFPPDFKEYPLGKTEVFTLNKGEMTPHWIRMPQGMRTKWTPFVSSQNYEIVFRDGFVVNRRIGDKPPEWKDDDFKFRSMEDGFEYYLSIKRTN